MLTAECLTFYLADLKTKCLNAIFPWRDIRIVHDDTIINSVRIHTSKIYRYIIYTSFCYRLKVKVSVARKTFIAISCTSSSTFFSD